ncbi:TadE family type IV pilus minor pilin [Rothia mucilaginosa]|uniref:TadE family protein n=1 Tax=Rothia mucilaginosa TaxID=43675 RepID=A0A0K2S0E5_9MICC|nr:TadE family type IV pilus minor pilin [Rothia mucilaginosa]BAS20287.1 TadE family protein [Rothia mucilaginosa]
MNAHVNLGAWARALPAGKAGAKPALSTPHKSPAEEGVITAEFAVALPAVTVVLALCLGAASTGVAQLKVEESARTAARAAARGDSEAQIRSAVSRIDPAQSVQISVSPNDAAVTEAGEGRARQVHVRVSRPAPGVIGSATGWVLRADAHARVEGGGENDTENGAGHEGE